MTGRVKKRPPGTGDDVKFRELQVPPHEEYHQENSMTVMRIGVYDDIEQQPKWSML
jgi:hypothetical protein